MRPAAVRLRAASMRVLAGAGLAAGALVLAVPAQAQSCLEQIVAVQQQLRQLEPSPNEPPLEQQSIGAQDGQQPTPGSLAAAGVAQPQTGALGALNQAMNLQAAGDAAGCLKAVAEARRLGGLD